MICQTYLGSSEDGRCCSPSTYQRVAREFSSSILTAGGIAKLMKLIACKEKELLGEYCVIRGAVGQDGWRLAPKP